MGKFSIGCLVIALIALVGIPSVLFLTGRGYMVQATVIAGVAGVLNALLWFRARRLVAYAVARSSLAAYWPLILLSPLALISMVLGAVMAFNVWTILLGWGPVPAVIEGWAWQLWLVVYVIGFFGWVGEGVNMASGGTPVQ